jgi:hypothetical protein
MSARDRAATNFWWVTARKQADRKGWHWDQYFGSRGDPAQAYDWGGPEWIRSPLSFANIKRMRIGDIVVAYQSGEGILGLVRLASAGYQHEVGRHFDTFNLDRRHNIRLGSPIPLQVIRALPNAKQSFQFLKVGRGTVFAIERMGFGRLSRLMTAFNMEIEDQIIHFLSKFMA